MATQRATAPSAATAAEGLCGRCRRELADAVYEVRAAEGTVARCLSCALVYWPLVRRSAVIALFVGTILVAINQGTTILGGDAASDLGWKVPLTYVVPYCVSMLGAILNARIRRSHTNGFDA